MRALRFERFGGPEVLEVRDVPRPQPGFGELLIEVHAAGLNPSDVKNVKGAMPQTKPPRIPGRDFAGVVVSGPEGWVGAEVFGMSASLGFTRDGSHAEFVVASADGVARKPEHIGFGSAATIGVPYVTAWEGLVGRAQAKAGESVLIVGGTGAVGTAVAQIARWSGLRVVATTLTAAQATEEWRRHIDVVIDLEREDLVKATLGATSGRGADIVYNAVGGPTFAPGVQALAINGRLVCITTTAEQEVRFNLFEFYRKNLTFLGVDSLKLTDATSGRILRQLVPGFESGALRVRPPETMPLEQGRIAYERLLAGTGGKIVLIPKE
jgi:NADPH:quinone reductase-like Zn-dependent oxidoreductase